MYTCNAYLHSIQHIQIYKHTMVVLSYLLTFYYCFQELLHEIRLMYQDLTNFTEDQIETFEEAGYYVMEVLPGLKVLSYNSNYG